MTPARKYAEARVRFWARVDRESAPSGCWPMTGTPNCEGRHRMTIDGFTDYGYRWAVCLTRGPQARETVHRHLCGNPACCRPDHISTEGGQRENNRDTVRHGRHRQAKLTPALACAMREAFAQGNVTRKALATKYGVSPSAVSAVLTGKTFARAGGPVVRSRKRNHL